MSPKLKEAIQTYVLLLPDLYYSVNDSNRLIMIAYQLKINDDYFNDEFEHFFFETLSNKFTDFLEEPIKKFCEERMRNLKEYLFVIKRLNEMNLLKQY